MFDNEFEINVKSIEIKAMELRLIMAEYELFRDPQINNFYLTILINRTLKDMEFVKANYYYTIPRDKLEILIKQSNTKV